MRLTSIARRSQPAARALDWLPSRLARNSANQIRPENLSRRRMESLRVAGPLPPTSRQNSLTPSPNIDTGNARTVRIRHRPNACFALDVIDNNDAERTEVWSRMNKH